MNTTELTEKTHNIDKRVTVLEVEQRNCRLHLTADGAARDARLDTHEDRLDAIDRDKNNKTALYSALGSAGAILVAFIMALIIAYAKSKV